MRRTRIHAISLSMTGNVLRPHASAEHSPYASDVRSDDLIDESKPTPADQESSITAESSCAFRQQDAVANPFGSTKLIYIHVIQATSGIAFPRSTSTRNLQTHA